MYTVNINDVINIIIKRTSGSVRFNKYIYSQNVCHYYGGGLVLICVCVRALRGSRFNCAARVRSTRVWLRLVKLLLYELLMEILQAV